MVRTGFGYDVHRLVEGRELRLCGVLVPYSMGLLGHSDADVAIHALCDALLGAAALRDIGYHFPDKSEEYRGIDSRVLLGRVAAMVSEAGYSISNVDVTIVAERPRLSGYIEPMRAELSRVLGVGLDQVSVKATTTEGLGFAGEGRGIAAMAVATLS